MDFLSEKCVCVENWTKLWRVQNLRVERSFRVLAHEMQRSFYLDFPAVVG